MSGYCDKCGHTACICGEMKMSDKIQMTEEQARNGICIFLKEYYDIETEECIRLMKLKEVNLIRKSDLEILIEEAEPILKM